MAPYFIDKGHFTKPRSRLLWGRHTFYPDFVPPPRGSPHTNNKQKKRTKYFGQVMTYAFGYPIDKYVYLIPGGLNFEPILFTF